MLVLPTAALKYIILNFITKHPFSQIFKKHRPLRAGKACYGTYGHTPNTDYCIVFSGGIGEYLAKVFNGRVVKNLNRSIRFSSTCSNVVIFLMFSCKLGTFRMNKVIY